VPGFMVDLTETRLVPNSVFSYRLFVESSLPLL